MNLVCNESFFERQFYEMDNYFINWVCFFELQF